MYGWRSRIGLIVPSNNTVIEPELYHVVPEGVSLHFTKLLLNEPIIERSVQDFEGEAVRILQHTGVDVIVYACMATSLQDSDQWERDTAERTGIATVTASNAVKEALRAVGAQSLALVCHYTKEQIGPVKSWFEANGLRVVSVETADVAGQREVNLIPVEEVYQLAQKADTSEAQAICLLATDLRTFPILQQVEDDLGKPVISTNQAILWRALQMVGIDTDMKGYGSLLSGDLKRRGV